MDTEPFDLESVYDEQIAPLMAQIIAICKEHRLPMLAVFFYELDAARESAGFCSSILHHGRKLPPQMTMAAAALQLPEAAITTARSA